MFEECNICQATRSYLDMLKSSWTELKHRILKSAAQVAEEIRVSQLKADVFKVWPASMASNIHIAAQTEVETLNNKIYRFLRLSQLLLFFDLHLQDNCAPGFGTTFPMMLCYWIKLLSTVSSCLQRTHGSTHRYNWIIVVLKKTYVMILIQVLQLNIKTCMSALLAV